MALTWAAAPAAGAAEGTAEGARDLQASIERYFGQETFEKGILTIAPRGDGYDFVFHRNRIAAKQPDLSAPDLPMTFHVVPEADDTYAFTSEGDPFAGSSRGGGAIPPLQNCQAHGVFDAKARYFASLDAGCDRIAISGQLENEPFSVGAGKISFHMSGKPAANGASDIDMAFDVPDLVTVVPNKDTPDPKDFSRITVGRIHYGIHLDAVYYAALFDVYRFALSLDTIAKAQAADRELRDRFKAVLPVWRGLQVEVAYDSVRVESTGVTVLLDHYGEKHNLSGIVKDGHYSLDVTLAGFSLAASRKPLPAGILPSGLELRFDVASVDLERIASATLDNPGTADAGLQSALVGLLIDGKAVFSADASVTASDYAVIGKAQAPITLRMQGTGSFSASGYDAISADVSQLKSDDVAGYALILAFLKGLARGTPDGRLAWDVALDLAARKITVNGQAFELPEKGKGEE
ncbi:hypothetical protein ACMDCR_20065 [Labrys okinawensis]|uniref:hypothetical protein n=1 Tax=Labrys okinawensis TaxID=346911 RepID=UPI0039BCDE4D